MQDLYNFPVLRSYIKFKTDFRLESYLLIIKDNKLRKLLSKFRLSSNNLQVELGRHTNAPFIFWQSGVRLSGI